MVKMIWCIFLVSIVMLPFLITSIIERRDKRVPYSSPNSLLMVLTILNCFLIVYSRLHQKASFQLILNHCFELRASLDCPYLQDSLESKALSGRINPVFRSLSPTQPQAISSSQTIGNNFKFPVPFVFSFLLSDPKKTIKYITTNHDQKHFCINNMNLQICLIRRN